MNKSFAPFLAFLLLVSACRSVDEGAYTGASFGAMLGGVVGSIAGGRNGDNIGTLVGMAAGGAAGAIVGKHNELQKYERVKQPGVQGQQPPAAQPTLSQCPLALQNLRFIDDDGNHTINRRETCKLIFELANRSGTMLYDVVPCLTEVSGNKHLSFSAFDPIDQIANGTVIRCTALIKADKRLKAGTANLQLTVSIRGREFLPLQEFAIATDK